MEEFDVAPIMNDISDVITHHIKKIIRSHAYEYEEMKTNMDILKRMPMFIKLMEECEELKRENSILKAKLQLQDIQQDDSQSEHIHLEVIEHVSNNSTEEEVEEVEETTSDIAEEESDEEEEEEEEEVEEVEEVEEETASDIAKKNLRKRKNLRRKKRKLKKRLQAILLKKNLRRRRKKKGRKKKRKRKKKKILVLIVV